MPSYYWIKLWLDTLNDPKMGTLPDRLWRRAIELFLVARTGTGDGYLPDLEDVAWSLRLSSEELIEDLMALENRTGIIQLREDGWYVTNFAKRQATITDKERQRRKRERDKEPSRNSHAPVTSCDLEAEAEADVQTTEAEADEQQQTTDTEGIDAVAGLEMLLEFGVGEPSASTLATCPLDHIEGHIADARSKTKNLDNPQGFVVGQLQKGIPPPAPPDPAADRRRYIEGEFADVIKH